MDLVDLIYSENHLPQLIKVLRAIRNRPLYVGVPKGDSFLNMIALVQEYGCHIHEHNKSGFLWIPTSNAKGRRPGEIPNLYIRGHAAGYNDSSSADGFCVCFVLKKSVDIPARPFLRDTYQKHSGDWQDLANKTVLRMALNNDNPDDFYNIVGDHVVNDIKDTIRYLMNPHNAPLTVERKGFNNPLIDTEALLNSITHIP